MGKIIPGNFLKQEMKLFFAAFSLILISSTVSLAASPPPLTKTLSKATSITVKGSKCELALASSSTSKVVVKCGKSTVGNRKLEEIATSAASSSSSLSLIAKQRVTIKANGCFLAVGSTSLKKISIKCLAKKPTATPTVTSTSTPTETPTSTPTSTATSTPTATPTSNANALLTSNQLVSFNTDTPNGALPAKNITGVTSGDVIKSIDRRPNNGLLYGLAFNSTSHTMQLYLISSQTGAATTVGSTGTLTTDGSTAVLTALDANSVIGIDFNPAADRIRVVTDSGNNFRINPNTGAFVDGDNSGLTSGVVTGTNPDGAINAQTTTVNEAAYTNNVPNNGNITTLYTLDSSTDSLYIQNPPNTGTQTSTLPLGTNLIAVRGFDIPRGVNASASNVAVTSGKAFAILELASSSQQLFCQVDLTTGNISNTDLIGGVSTDLLGLAVQSASGTPLIALSSDGANLLRFNSATPGTITVQAISTGSLVSGETLVGMDFRPATGQLMGLGVNATANTATLYVIDPQTGTVALAATGTQSAIAFVDGSASAVDLPDPATISYGINFNPTVDRIRVVTGTGLNFRVVPTTGLPVDGNLGGSSTPAGINTDGNINGATTTASGTSYTNSFAGTAVTTQYTIDNTTNSFYIQNPPNSGTQTLEIPVTLGGSVLNFSGDLGFDIAPEVKTTSSSTAVSSGSAFAALSVGGTTSLYSINLVTGAATNLGAIGAGSTTISALVTSQTSVD